MERANRRIPLHTPAPEQVFSGHAGSEQSTPRHLKVHGENINNKKTSRIETNGKAEEQVLDAIPVIAFASVVHALTSFHARVTRVWATWKNK